MAQNVARPRISRNRNVVTGACRVGRLTCINDRILSLASCVAADRCLCVTHLVYPAVALPPQTLSKALEFGRFWTLRIDIMYTSHRISDKVHEIMQPIHWCTPKRAPVSVLFNNLFVSVRCFIKYRYYTCVLPAPSRLLVDCCQDSRRFWTL